jgi:two-component system alkaline phosphatase synthesis response regulator PhoP
MTHRILVVDDDRELVRLVRTYLEQNGYEVLTAYDGHTALHILRREHPDLMLVDLMLPGRDDLDATRVGRGKGGLAAMPIITLTAHAENSRIGGPEPGAQDSATRTLNSREVLARIRAVLRRVEAEPARPRVIQVRGLVIDLDAHTVACGGRPVHLTPTEFALLCALAEQPGHALTRLEMIEKGLGYGYGALERTVDSHIKNLRRKLDEAGEAASLVETVFGIGYRLAISDPT